MKDGTTNFQKNCPAPDPNNPGSPRYRRIPGVEFNISYDLTHGNLRDGKWAFSNGSTAPEGFGAGEREVPHLHGDYMAAWTEDSGLFDSGSFLDGRLPMQGIVWCNQTNKNCSPKGQTDNLRGIQATSRFNGGMLVEGDNDTRNLPPLLNLPRTIGASPGHGDH